MAWKGRRKDDVDFKNLLSTLNTTKLQSTDPMLYQTIKQLIDKSQQSRQQVSQILNTFIGDVNVEDSADLQAILNAISTINAFLQDGSFLTYLDESNSLPTSRQLIAGTNVAFDDTVAFQRIINVTGGSGDSYIPLSLGIEPLQFMSDGLGQPILIPFTP